jgi:hypothetical protein
MSGLRVDTFKIFNSRRDLRPDRAAPFNHIRGRVASPGLDDGSETLFLQWLTKALWTPTHLPAVRRAGYPRRQFRWWLSKIQPLNLKQVAPYGGH